MGAWKTVRVFISSTFRDMQSERDWLVKRVFPALRQRLEARRIHLVDVDLRWGITGEQADNDQVLGLCLHQIDDCRPFFLGLLGSRYGWVPGQLPVEVTKRYGWTQYQTGKSITELEILYGALSNAAMSTRALLCLRSEQFLSDVSDHAQRRVYVEGPTDEDVRALGPDEAERLATTRASQLEELKKRIRAQSATTPVFDSYPCAWDTATQLVTGLTEFGLWVADMLERAILRAPEVQAHLVATRSSAESDELADERAFHERFIEARTRAYVRRPTLDDELAAFACDHSDRPCLLTGSSGSGKSAALAKLVETWRDRHPEDVVIGHFVGAGPRSTAVREMLHHLCAELKDAFKLRDRIEDGVRQLSDQFRDLVARIPAHRRTILVIDAVNQLDNSASPYVLQWLPRRTLPHVRLIVSVTDEPGSPAPALEILRRREPNEITVGPLSDEERLEIVREVPSIAAKTLDIRQTVLLTGNPATRNPLFLTVALEELRGFGSFDDLNRRIAGFPSTDDALAALFRQVIERLATDFDAATVQDVLCTLACSRRGLAERELLDLIEGPAVPIERSEGDLFPLLRQLRPFLQMRGSLLDFANRHLNRAVQDAFFERAGVERAQIHGRLAAYFKTHADPGRDLDWNASDSRAFFELPYQLAHSGGLEEVVRTLTDLVFVEAKCRAGLTFDLVADYDFARRVCPASAELGAFERFLSQHASVIAGDPTLVLPFAFNHSDSGPVCDGATRLLRTGRRRWQDGSWVELVERPPFVEVPALVKTLTGHTGEVTTVAVTPDGRRAVSGSVDGTIRIWNVPAGSCDYIVDAHAQGVNAVAITADGSSVASAGADGRVRFWRGETAEHVRTIEADPVEALSVALGEGGAVAYIGDTEGTIGVWSVEDGQMLHRLAGHFGPVGSLALSADGSTLVSGSWDCMVRLWDTAGHRNTKTLLGHAVPVTGVAVDAAGRRVASSSGMPPDGDGRVSMEQIHQSEVRVWENGLLLQRLQEHEHSFRGGRTAGVGASVVNGVAISGDGRLAVSVGYDSNVVVNTLDGWEWPSRVLNGHVDSVRCVAIDAAGALAVTGGADRTVRVWDLEGETARLQRVVRIGRIGRGRCVPAATRARLLWRNTRLRLSLLLPLLSIAFAFAVARPVVAWLGGPTLSVKVSVGNAVSTYGVLIFIEWRALLKLDPHAWRRSLLPGAVWATLGWLSLPLWWLFPVLNCPRCGELLCGRRRLFACASCGFRDRLCSGGRW